MIPAGIWVSGSKYEMLDVVVHAGSSYVAKKNIINSAKTPPSDAANWQLLAQGYDVTSLVTKDKIVNNFLATDPTMVLGAPMGKQLKDEIDKQSSDLAAVETDLSNVHVQIDPLKANYVNDINRNIVNKVNIVLWDSKTTDTPFKTGNTIRGNGFCITYSSGEPFLCQLAMAVGDSHLFTRHMNEGGWSGWTTIGTP